jgi:apocytochrome f
MPPKEIIPDPLNINSNSTNETTNETREFLAKFKHGKRDRRFFSKLAIFTRPIIVMIVLTVCIYKAVAFPVYAQNAYTNPREANGRIVCANCHLAQKPVEIESPSSVLPNSVFEAVVKIPYNLKYQQILGSGGKGGLNVGAVVILPDGFKLAPAKMLSSEIKTKNRGIFIAPYSATQENILIVGPIGGDKHQEITFPIISPDPKTNKEVNFLKYPIYVGANRGRGQVNPTGEKSNNNPFLATTNGQITHIGKGIDNNTSTISIKTITGEIKIQEIPKNYELLISEGKIIKQDQLLTKDPNVGGFGQTETEIVLQNPFRIVGCIVLLLSVLLCQLFLVLKKKQFEKVQAAEMSF